MFRFLRISFVVIFFFFTGCGTQGESDLSKALSDAVRQKKVSQRKMDSIMKEYDMLRDEDMDITRKYVEAILNALKMGGDSSHIDVVRRMLAVEDGKVRV
jgi:hypothetical protein